MYCLVHQNIVMATSKTTEDVRQIMIETARVQFATLNAGIVFWSGWLESASKLAQTLNTELTSLGADGSDSNVTLSRITDSSREYLRKITELPGAATARFNRDVAVAGPKQHARTRAARAKA
jgi:hypothetical protein